MIHLVQQYFSESTKKNPKKIAVDFQNQKITYKDLDIYTNQLARALKKEGIKRGDRVSFCLFKSINSIKAILGILKADAIYVPLDPFSPQERMKKIIDDAVSSALICDEHTLSAVKKIQKAVKKKIKIFVLSNRRKAAGGCVFEDEILKAEKTALSYKNTDRDLAYIFYTSGSTGLPKGVMISHLNLISATEWAVEEFNITSDDILSSHPPFHFDLSTFDIYCAFKSGATLCVVPEKLSLFPGSLLKYIEEKKMTIWSSVPSLLCYVVKAGILNKHRIPSVKKIFFNGEVFPPKFLSRWMKTFPKKEFINMYGPTEATVQCAFYRIKGPLKDLTKPAPIGRASGNSEIFAVTEEGKPVLPGQTGELYIGGSGLSLGYWNDEQKTEKSFVRNPFDNIFSGKVYKTGDLVFLRKDGNYEFLGRKDHQIKYMGYRIELGEIEWALQSLKYVDEAVALAFGEQGDDVKIVSFLVLNKKTGEAKIKADLKKIIPPYMIPRRFEILSALPKTSTGKINRVVLKHDYEKTC